MVSDRPQGPGGGKGLGSMKIRTGPLPMPLQRPTLDPSSTALAQALLNQWPFHLADSRADLPHTDHVLSGQVTHWASSHCPQVLPSSPTTPSLQIFVLRDPSQPFLFRLQGPKPWCSSPWNSPLIQGRTPEARAQGSSLGSATDPRQIPSSTGTSVSSSIK